MWKKICAHQIDVVFTMTDAVLQKAISLLGRIKIKQDISI
jgi:hypothetical protein